MAWGGDFKNFVNLTQTESGKAIQRHKKIKKQRFLLAY